MSGSDVELRQRKGFLAAILAFVIWGVLPLYLRALKGVPPLEIMAHRMVWSCLLIYVFLWLRGEQREPLRVLGDPKTRRGLCASALLVSVNWLGFVWAVSMNRTLDASLGYFINPLLNVLLGVFVLRERLRPAQWLAVAIAAGGVLYLAVAGGEVPWLALIIAVSFASYGLIRKLIAVEAVTGLAAETTLLTPFATLFLGYCLSTRGAFYELDKLSLLMLGGPITAVPLAAFAYGARSIPLATVGLLQYLAPTMQLLCGALVFGEPFQGPRATGFVIIWLALGVYAGEDLLRRALSAKHPEG